MGAAGGTRGTPVERPIIHIMLTLSILSRCWLPDLAFLFVKHGILIPARTPPSETQTTIREALEIYPVHQIL